MYTYIGSKNISFLNDVIKVSKDVVGFIKSYGGESLL